MAYTPTTYVNSPATTTPLSAANLNKAEQAISANATAVDTNTTAIAALRDSLVIDIANPAYGLPAPGTASDAAIAAAYAATPVGGTLDLGNRDITVAAQLTIAKKITLRNGRLIANGVRPLLVTASGTILKDVQITRTGAVGASGSAITVNATNVVVNNLTTYSASGDGFEGASGSCNGLRINGGYFESGSTGGKESLIIESGAQNDDIKISGATVRHSGYGTGITIYSGSNCTIEKCDVRGIRGNPWFDLGNGAWTLFSGSVWRATERADGVQSNAVWVGTDSGTWATTKVEYLEGSSTTLSAGQYYSQGDGFLYIRLTDSTDPNNKFTRTRRTNGYGILMYSTVSATAGIQNNLIAQNYVSDTDGFGIYYKAQHGDPKTNRTYMNLLEDVCKLGNAVSSLPFAGFGVLATSSLIMVGDVVRRAGTAAFPVPAFKFLRDATLVPDPALQAFGLRAEESTGLGYNVPVGHWSFTNCVALNSASSGWGTGTQTAGDCYLELIGCEAVGNGTLSASSGVNMSGTTLSTRVTIIGGRYMDNTLRGINLTTCIDSKIIGVTCGGNTQQGINISTCSRLLIIGPILVGDDDVSIDSGTTGLTFIPGTEGTGTTHTISCTNWRTGDGGYAGTGSPESVLTAAVGSTFTRRDGGSGTTLYVKESGTGNTGWVAQASGAASPPQFNFLSTFGTNPWTAMNVTAAQTVGTANLGFAVLVKPVVSLTLNFLDWVAGSVSAGNYDIGVYTGDGATKLWSKGSTAWPTASTLVTETVSPGVALAAGTTYRIILAGSDTTANYRGFTFVGGMGKLVDGTVLANNVSSAVPLGASITLGSASVKVPLIQLRQV